MGKLFWFGVGGATAYWIHRNKEEGRERWGGHCMRHSWGSRSQEDVRDIAVTVGTAPRQEEGSPQSRRDETGRWRSRPELEKDVLHASDKLVSTVKSGVQSVLDMLTEMEGRINKQQALHDQQLQQLPDTTNARPTQVPVAPSATGPATMVQTGDATNNRTMLPTYTQASTTSQSNDPAISQILNAIEKLNTRIDALSPLKKDDTPPARLV